MPQLLPGTFFKCSLLFLIFNWIGISDSSEVNPNPTNYKTREGCICPFVYIPVCGSDGKTYGNGCELECAQRSGNYVLGVCKGECPCCKPPYHNDPFPVEFPEQTGGGEGPVGGWGWKNKGLNYGRWNTGFPFYPSSNSYPLGSVRYIPVTKKKYEEEEETLEVSSEKSEAIQEQELPVAVPSSAKVTKTALPSEDIRNVKPVKQEKRVREAQSLKKLAVIDDPHLENED